MTKNRMPEVEAWRNKQVDETHAQYEGQRLAKLDKWQKHYDSNTDNHEARNSVPFEDITPKRG